MKNRFIAAKLAGAVLAISLACPLRSAAQVSQEDFNALKKVVEQMNEKFDKMEQIHEQDQQQIQQLKQQLGEAQAIATNAEQKAEAAAQVQPTAAAPSGPPASHNFSMVGDAEVQFGKYQGSHGGFALADFAPIFLYRGGDKVLFEAGFDTMVNNSAPAAAGSSTSFSLSFAQMDYLMSDYATLVAGYMLLPLGTYTERGAGWLNKIPDTPLPRNVLLNNGAGVQVRGAVPIGQTGQSVTYAAYVANGPSSADGTGNAASLDLGGNFGLKSDGTFGNLHSSPGGGGRLGWFYPWKPHYDVELGLSGETGPWDDAGHRLWTAGVVDAALHLGPAVEVKGEYAYTSVESDDLGAIHPEGWWIQAGYKLSGLNLDLPLINNIELVGRFDTFTDALGTDADRYTAGWVYYFSNTLLFEGDFEAARSHGPAALPTTAYILQLSYGF